MASIPHGGILVDKILKRKEVEMILSNLKDYKTLNLNQDLAMDAEKIAIGAFSPLEGFLNQANYLSVINNKRLGNGVIWTLPIILPLDKKKADNFNELEEIVLMDQNKPIALFKIEEKYKRNKEEEAKKVYGTINKKHPGVANIYNDGEIILGGKVFLLQRRNSEFKNYELTPEQTRKIFEGKKFNSVVAFHTRNVPHRGHEYIQKAALEQVDGLFIHPVIGRKKKGDFKAECILKTYEELIDNFFPKGRIVLSALSTYSRYAGPREAVFTALIRKNYGATHFILGRDHTGVGNFYDKSASHDIFSEFDESDLGIKPMFFSTAYYCERCDGMATEKNCPHEERYHKKISGTKIREMIENGITPPKEFIRPEISKLLDKNSFVI